MLFFKSLINSFCLCLFTYIFLYLIINLMPYSIQKYGLLNNSLNLSYLVQAKAKAVTSSINETNLGLNFIGNFHTLSPLEAQIFQSSGLVHLLAISGAQILPIVELLCFFTSLIIYSLLKNKVKPHLIMNYCSKTRKYLSFFVSIFIAILFGGTGALLRVAWLNFFKKTNLLHVFQLKIFIIMKEFIEPLVNKILIIILISILFGNIFLNYSFILSAIGASCAEISAFFCLILFKTKDNPSKNINLFQKFFKSKIFIEILTTLVTCIFVGFILSPLTYNSILNSCLANIFAIPIVTFLVTPLSLLVLITPIGNLIFNLLLNSLDYSLSLFKYIAIVFSEDDLSKITIKNTQLFSQDGLLYLNVIMLVLWVVVDLIRGRKIALIRATVLAQKQ